MKSIGKGSGSRPKSYVWPFRLDLRQLQRLFMAGLHEAWCTARTLKSEGAVVRDSDPQLAMLLHITACQPSHLYLLVSPKPFAKNPVPWRRFPTLWLRLSTFTLLTFPPPFPGPWVSKSKRLLFRAPSAAWEHAHILLIHQTNETFRELELSPVYTSYTLMISGWSLDCSFHSELS